MRTRKVPRGARHLRTYAEYESYLADFLERRYQLLQVVGRTGLMKTESLRAAARGRSVCHFKGGQLTPLQFYIECYVHRGEPIVLDDAEHLLDHKIGAKLVVALADTTPVKRLCYATTSRALGDVPQAFLTTSPLCILANQASWDEALLSRGPTAYFDPANLEVHRAVARWFWDQEIHDWFGQHLYRLPPLDCRWYVIADQDKRSHRDWRQIVLSTHAPDRPSCLVQDLETDAALPTREAKADRFAQLMENVRGASRASYFRLRKRLEDEDRLVARAVAPIPLRRTRPPAIPSLLELDSLEALPPDETEVEPQPIDVPLREAFSEPIRGATPPPAPPARPNVRADDLLPWERPEHRDDEEEG